MTNNKITITVVNTPSYITCYCPHCNEEIKIPYQDFIDMMPEETITYDSDYREWIDEKFLCPKCGKEIEVEYVNVN